MVMLVLGHVRIAQSQQYFAKSKVQNALARRMFVGVLV